MSHMAHLINQSQFFPGVDHFDIAFYCSIKIFAAPPKLGACRFEILSTCLQWANVTMNSQTYTGHCTHCQSFNIGPPLQGGPHPFKQLNASELYCFRSAPVNQPSFLHMPFKFLRIRENSALKSTRTADQSCVNCSRPDFSLWDPPSLLDWQSIGYPGFNWPHRLSHCSQKDQLAHRTCVSMQQVDWQWLQYPSAALERPARVVHRPLKSLSVTLSLMIRKWIYYEKVYEFWQHVHNGN